VGEAQPGVAGASGDAPASARTEAAAVRRMLEARSVALVGASPRPGSLASRALAELERSPARPDVVLVNPRHASIGSRRCVASLAEVRDPVDLVLLAVPDRALEDQLRLAAARGDASAVIFGAAGDAAQRERLGAIARGAGMALCGAGCMGFVNNVVGLRAVGYLEPFPLPTGPVGLVTHSGSVFSALLRADRAIGWALAVSSGQELVTTAASYLDYALSTGRVEVVALVVETLREPGALAAALTRASAAGAPVVALAMGCDPASRALVEAHSGALAGDDAAFDAFFEAHGVHRVEGLGELCDVLELLCVPGTRSRRRRWGGLGPREGIAVVHDSGGERVHVLDVAQRVGLRFACVGEETLHRLRGVLEPGLEATNPLDVWGTGRDAERLIREALVALGSDERVRAVALGVDLVPELDGDESYRRAALDAHLALDTPVCVLSNLPAAIDRPAARRLRDAGVPVLEGTRPGLRALRHLVEPRERVPTEGLAAAVRPERRRRHLERLARGGRYGALEGFELLADYAIPAPAARRVQSEGELVKAAAELGWPLVLKSDEPGVAHKSDVEGVVLGLSEVGALERAYRDLAGRLGRQALLQRQVERGVELSLGVVRDPLVGPLVVVAAGGTLVELLADRVVALPHVAYERAERLLGRLRVARLLEGWRGAPPVDLDAVAAAVRHMAEVAAEIGEGLRALEVNPLACRPDGVEALDCLVLPVAAPLDTPGGGVYAD
jgi:acyl-CoA synthetase (NDP forming)